MRKQTEDTGQLEVGVKFFTSDLTQEQINDLLPKLDKLKPLIASSLRQVRFDVSQKNIVLNIMDTVAPPHTTKGPQKKQTRKRPAGPKRKE